MSKKKDKKVILFSTRFIETKDKLFCENNIDSREYCCSQEYLKFFLSDNLPSEIVQYFNRLYYKSFFSQYKDNDGKSIINVEDNSKEIQDKLEGKIPEVNYSKVQWANFFSDLDKKEKLFEISVNKEKAKFELKDKDVDAKSLLKIIQDNKGTIYNQDVVLNTDFGGATDKQTIDRRFKIYKLKGSNADNVQAIYGVWCLKEKSKEEEWYKALYEELKAQMKNEFDSVTEILYFLHDGDIGEKKTFEVKHYKENDETFGFLNKEESLSVAIYQHSLSSIATVLSTTDIDSAIKKALEEMEKGGKRAFLNELSDAVACWHDGGRGIYMDIVEKGKIKYGIESLVSKEDIEKKNKSVDDVFKEVRHQINNLHGSDILITGC